MIEQFSPRHDADLAGQLPAVQRAAYLVDSTELVVDPGLHRRGIGSGLLAAVLADAADRRVTVSVGDG